MKIIFRTLAVSIGIIVSLTATAAAAQWKYDNDAMKWWYENDDGSYPKSQWAKIDGADYYFDTDGYMLTDTITPDGYRVGFDGAWIPDDYVYTPDVAYNGDADPDSPYVNANTADYKSAVSKRTIMPDGTELGSSGAVISESSNAAISAIDSATDNKSVAQGIETDSGSSNTSVGADFSKSADNKVNETAAANQSESKQVDNSGSSSNVTNSSTASNTSDYSALNGLWVMLGAYNKQTYEYQKYAYGAFLDFNNGSGKMSTPTNQASIMMAKNMTSTSTFTTRLNNYYYAAYYDYSGNMYALFTKGGVKFMHMMPINQNYIYVFCKP